MDWEVYDMEIITVSLGLDVFGYLGYKDIDLIGQMRNLNGYWRRCFNAFSRYVFG